MPIYPLFLGKDLAESMIQLLLEAEQPIVIYPGRFQPFHRGHYEVYKSLVEKYGDDRVFIATSDKTEPGKSPFNFDDKQNIMTKMFDIDPEHIIKAEKSPYNPDEFIKKLPPGTPVVFAIGEKDAARMKGFASVPGDIQQMAGFDTKVYAMSVPMIDGAEEVSGEAARAMFASDNEEGKQELFRRMYGRDNNELLAYIVQQTTKSAKEAQLIQTQKQTKAAAPKMYQFAGNRIVNPETDREITVQTALAYPEIHPAHQAAQRYLKSKGVLRETLQDFYERGERESLFERYLVEGGAYGHMLHPYEDMDLTFDDLKELARRSLSGTLGKEGPVSEKMDGQNVMVTFRDGEIRFARNKGHLKNAGETALRPDELRAKFAGRGSLESSFGDAADNLQTAIEKLSNEEQTKIFGNGTKFLNVEILHPSTENLIPYDQNILVLHQVIEVDKNGDVIDADDEGGEALVGELRKVGAQKQKQFDIQARNPLQVFAASDASKMTEKVDEYLTQLDEIRKVYGLTDEDTLGDYKSRALGEFLDDSGEIFEPQEKELLLKRWADGQKGMHRLNMLTTPEKIEWAKGIESHITRTMTDLMRPVQMFVARLGVDTISNSTNVLAASNPEAAKIIMQKLHQAMAEARATGSPDVLDKMTYFLKRIDELGIDKLVPTEGIVFPFKDKLYKFTGLFAPIHQAVNIIRFGRVEEPGTPTTPPVEPAAPPGMATQRPPQVPAAPQKPEVVPKVSDFRSSIEGLLDRTIRNPVTKNMIKIRSALEYPEDHPAHQLAKQVIQRMS